MDEPLDVIYVDNHLLVVNKPAGLATQPSRDNPHSLETVAKQWIKEKYQKPGAVFLHAVHRLDKPVSGLVLFARTSKALSRLQAAMRTKRLSKRYVARIEGTPPQQKGVLEHYLVHDDYRARVVKADDPKGKFARLTYEVVKSTDRWHEVLVDLETGRYHQIRIQFSAIGCPIVGDRKYGSRIPLEEEGIALHHMRMEVPHPTTGKTLVFEATLE